LAAFPKGFRDVCGSPLSITRFLHMLAKSRNGFGEREINLVRNEKDLGELTHRFPSPTILENV
jgi:hypothetical protein